jgi:acyl carrier protein
MSVPTAEQILDDLAGILRHFNDREYSGPLGAETLFFADLGLASIDAVVLAETLEQHYGRKFPFQQLLSELGQREARDLELGRLAAFLHRTWPRRPGEG